MYFLPLLCTLAAHAGTVAGVKLPEEIQVGGETLILNGMGLREKYWLDIYVAGLYIPYHSDDPDHIIYENVPKRLHSKFIYPRVPKE